MNGIRLKCSESSDDNLYLALTDDTKGVWVEISVKLETGKRDESAVLLERKGLLRLRKWLDKAIEQTTE